MPMIDLINNDGSIKNQFIKEVSTGSDYSNSYTPEEISKIQAVSNMNDLRTGSTLGSTFSNLRTKENDYNQKLIQIRNKGIEALMDIPASKRAKAYPKLVSMLKNQGADIGLPAEYDEDTLKLMNGRDQDWLSKMALQHRYRLAEIAARGVNSEKDYYDIESQKKSAQKNIELLASINSTEQNLPQLKKDLDEAKLLAPEASYTGLEKTRDFIASPFTQTKGAESRSLLETKLKSNIIPRIMSIIQDRYTAEEAKQVINNLYNESDSPKVKIEKINSFYEKELDDLSSKKKQANALVKQTGYGKINFNNNSSNIKSNNTIDYSKVSVF